MGAQQTAVNTAFSLLGGAMPAGNIHENPEDFAELVCQEEVAAFLAARDRQRLIERASTAEERKWMRAIYGPEALLTASVP